MIWVVSIGIAIIALLFFMRSKSDQSADVRAQVRDAKTRAESLPMEQRRELADDIREGALENYDRNFKIAKDHGKDNDFAHQIGVLSAVKSICAPRGTSSRQTDEESSLEGVPFNKADPSVGRIAIAEYLVWKFFPTEADEALFARSLLVYRDEIIEAAQIEDEPDQFMMTMLYSMRFDWMRWIANNTPSV